MTDPSPPAPDRRMSDRTAGFLAGVSVYALWGFFPLYFALMRHINPLEVLAHRIVWSFVGVLIVLALLRRPWGWLRQALRRPVLLRMLAASALIAINWLTYIYAVTVNKVVEASLGYFINPLVNILFGVLFFGERLTRGGKAGVLLAVVGVAVISSESWQGLWISLTLALTFGLYGAVKKATPLPGLEGLFVESALLMPLALPYLIAIAAVGTGHFITGGAGITWLLVAAGPATAFPLWLFAVTTKRIALATIGVLQFMTPTIQFLLGITLFGQHVTASYWAGLVLVWLGCASYLTSAVVGRLKPTPPA